MILSDFGIQIAIQTDEIKIDPFTWAHVQPASVDLCLGDTFMTMSGVTNIIDPRVPGHTSFTVIKDLEYLLLPNTLVLAKTLERVRVGNSLVAKLEGKSSLGRLGLIVHATAGFVDPGFNGNLTLELVNLNSRPILLTAGMKIAQIAFTRLSSPAIRPYGSLSLESKYQNQTEPTESKYHENYRSALISGAHVPRDQQ